MHEVTSAQAFEGLRETGRKVRRPELAHAVEKPTIATCRPPTAGRASADPDSAKRVATLENNTHASSASNFSA